jgi:hypothetical protein
MTQPVDHVRDEPLCRGWIREVSLKELSTPAMLLDALDRLLRATPVSIGMDGNIGPFTCIGKRGGPANTTVRARDQGDFSFKSHLASSSLISFRIVHQQTGRPRDLADALQRHRLLPVSFGLFLLQAPGDKLAKLLHI